MKIEYHYLKVYLLGKLVIKGNIIYYLLFIIYYLLFIIYYLLFIIYYLLFIIYYLLFIIYYLLFINSKVRTDYGSDYS